MKTGDRVKIVNTDYNSLELANGQEGVVLEAFETPDGMKAVRVALDSGWTPFHAKQRLCKQLDAELGGISMDGWHFYVEELEVIQKEA